MKAKNHFHYSHGPVLPPLTIFDVETTGLDPNRGHRIIEIAGVRVEHDVILRESAFVTFVNPERQIPWDARRVNKISDDEVKAAPTIDLVLPQFIATRDAHPEHNGNQRQNARQENRERACGEEGEEESHRT